MVLLIKYWTVSCLLCNFMNPLIKVQTKCKVKAFTVIGKQATKKTTE